MLHVRIYQSKPLKCKTTEEINFAEMEWAVGSAVLWGVNKIIYLNSCLGFSFKSKRISVLPISVAHVLDLHTHAGLSFG